MMGVIILCEGVLASLKLSGSAFSVLQWTGRRPDWSEDRVGEQNLYV